MNAELSRRAAYAFQFSPLRDLSILERTKFAMIVDITDTFEDLPKKYQDLIIEVERSKQFSEPALLDPDDEDLWYMTEEESNDRLNNGWWRASELLVFARPYDYEGKIAQHQEVYRDRMEKLATDLKDGKIKIDDWVYRTQITIQQYTLDGYRLGVAKAQGIPPSRVQLTPDQRREANAQVIEQFNHFTDFVKTMRAKVNTDEELTSYVQGRARQYGGSIRSAYSAAELVEMGSIELQWVRHKNDSCETCLANDGVVKMAQSWLDSGVWPAHGTICHGNCGCSFRLVSSKKFHQPGQHNQASHGGGGSVPQASDVEEYATKSRNRLKRIVSQRTGRNWTDDEIETATVNKLTESLEKTELSVRMESETLGQVLNSGQVLNQYQSGSSNMVYDPEGRKKFERSMFGLPENANLDDYPIYGYFKIPGELDSTRSFYGDARVVLKKDVRDRSTFTIGDSLDQAYRPSSVTKPHLGSVASDADESIFNLGKSVADNMPYRPPSYMEAQIHGGLKLNDIERVSFRKPPTDELQRSLKSLGIQYDTDD